MAKKQNLFLIPAVCLAWGFVMPFAQAQQNKTIREVVAGDKKGEEAVVRTASIEFTNHLGMKFVQIDSVSPLFSIWETRVADFRAFLAVSGRRTKQVYFKQRGDHPVVNVSWEDAIAFCSWLTRKELQSGVLPEGCRYRLPTSEEWSLAVGMPPPEDPLKQLSVDTSASGYPWGAEWPPQKGAGNYHPDLAVDTFQATAPVGSFTANQFGLYDLGGNVWEWCQDQYGNSVDFRTLRGASWRMRSAGDLLSGFTIGNITSLRLETYGFRVVLDLPKSQRSVILKKLPSSSGQSSKKN
ncbi:MAG: SUMF1/EgtB/PvdO family nonheme iron enzyme [Verrucomicrobiota bacterium]